MKSGSMHLKPTRMHTTSDIEYPDSFIGCRFRDPTHLQRRGRLINDNRIHRYIHDHCQHRKAYYISTQALGLGHNNAAMAQMLFDRGPVKVNDSCTMKNAQLLQVTRQGHERETGGEGNRTPDNPDQLEAARVAKVGEQDGLPLRYRLARLHAEHLQQRFLIPFG